MSRFKKVITLAIVILAIGGIAQGYNEAHHKEMALEQCGSQHNIERVDSKGFECKQGSNETETQYNK